MMANHGNIAEDTLFEPERLAARAIDWDRSDRGLHQGAQPPCCNPDAVYMAATDITPASPEKPLPRGSHPYTVRARWATGRARGRTGGAAEVGRAEPVTGRDLAPHGVLAGGLRPLAALRPLRPQLRRSPALSNRRPPGSDRWRSDGRPFAGSPDADGVYLQARMEPTAECMLVVIGFGGLTRRHWRHGPASPTEGRKELPGFQVGLRESARDAGASCWSTSRPAGWGFLRSWP